MKKIIIFLMALYLTGCTNGVVNEEPKIPTTTIHLIDNLNFEINSKLELYSLFSIDNGILVTANETVDTSLLGIKEINISYINDLIQEEKYSFNINIIDTQSPKIEYKKELTTTAGLKIDLLKNVKATDNSKETIKPTVEGKYNFNVEGTYNLSYSAIDSSGNKTTVLFVLKVKPEDTSEIDALINEVFRLTNKEREALGLKPLKFGSTALMKAAKTRAKEISSHFSHTRPNGKDGATVVDGIKRGWFAENLGKNQKTPAQVVKEWMSSSNHRSNLLGAHFTEIGIGVYIENGVYYWVQIFISN